MKTEQQILLSAFTFNVICTRICSAVATDNVIREPFLRELVRSPLNVRAVVRGATNGFLVVARVGESERVLETARGGARLFASLDTAASFVQEIGLPVFEVDMSGYQPGRLRKARPDRAAALKRTRTQMQQQELKGFE